MRPVNDEDGTKFVKLDGTFKKFCREVADEGDVDCLHFLIIDEINRADLSKVFGELMYCLEKDKRAKYDKTKKEWNTEHSVKTQYQELTTYEIENGELQTIEDDCFKDGFYIPENIVIIGTMNDIDRSVESMDFALRRRFYWKEFKVDEDTLKDAFEAMKCFEGKDIEELVNRIVKLNEVIKESGKEFGLNEQYYISQGHFANIDKKDYDIEDLCNFVWDYRLESLLREYVRGADGDKIEKFIEKCKEAF